jgi:hypothetical protein
MTLIPGAPRLFTGAPRYSEGWQVCPPRVWYSPEIDASKFTLHILSDTPGGFQWLKYILLMLCNATRRLGNGKRVILPPRVRGFIWAVIVVRNTWVFLMETKVVADVLNSSHARAMIRPVDFENNKIHQTNFQINCVPGYSIFQLLIFEKIHAGYLKSLSRC